MEDLNGDKVYGCKTLPIVFGIRKTKGFVFTAIVIVRFIDFHDTFIHYFTNDLPSFFNLATSSGDEIHYYIYLRQIQ